MDTKACQVRVMKNKVAKGFNVTDVGSEFKLLLGEVDEAIDAWRRNEGLAEELADVAIYLLSIAEICGINLGEAIEGKMRVNESRKYIQVGGAFVKVPEDDAPLG